MRPMCATNNYVTYDLIIPRCALGPAPIPSARGGLGRREIPANLEHQSRRDVAADMWRVFAFSLMKNSHARRANAARRGDSARAER